MVVAAIAHNTTAAEAAEIAAVAASGIVVVADRLLLHLRSITTAAVVDRVPFREEADYVLTVCWWDLPWFRISIV